MKGFLLLIYLFIGITVNAKEKQIQLFPRTYGYFARGDEKSQTITYDHNWGEYGWKNHSSEDLSTYNYIILKIEPTDSKVEVRVLYDEDEMGTRIGQIEKGKTKAVCKFDSMRKVVAIYLVKSKSGIVRIDRFVLIDRIKYDSIGCKRFVLNNYNT